MLNELFSWIMSGQESTPFRSQVITREALDVEQKKALAQRKELLGEIYQATFEQSSSRNTNTAPRRLDMHHAYMAFLTFCKEVLSQDAQIHSYPLAMLFVMSQRKDKPLAVRHVFSAFLKEDKDAALQFFGKHEADLRTFPMVTILISAAKSAEHLKGFVSQLQTQENARALIPLMKQYIDDVEAYAAAILWLLQRGVTVDDILASNMLQNFMSYNLYSLNAPDSPVKTLYQILDQFPEAKALVSAAGTVCTEERGFYNLEAGASSYAITGVLCAQNQLHRVAVNIPAMDFSGSLDNFNALYQQFHLPFLLAAVVWASAHQNETWLAALRNVLNGEEGALTELPSLIDTIAVNCGDDALEMLSGLITDEKAETWLLQHQSAVLYLLPYKSSLRLKLSADDLSQYLLQVVHTQRSVWDTIPKLLTALIAFQHDNITLANVVYEKILDLILQHTELLEDRTLVRQLRKYAEKEAVFARRAELLDAQFDQCVAMFSSEEASLTLKSYQLMEDRWVDVIRKLNVLSSVTRLTFHCPVDKYTMQAHIARVYYSRNPSNFRVNDFISALGLSGPFLLDGVNEYERVLIELLTTIDDEAIRHHIVDMFEQNDAKRTHWMQFPYGGEDVLTRALKAGHVGLIAWLSERIDVDCNAAIHAAAAAGQWHVVEYFCNTHRQQLRLENLKELLILAAEEGQLSTVTMLCHSTEVDCNAAIHAAAAAGQWGIVEYFCNSGTQRLEQANLKELMILAAEEGQLSTVTLLCHSAINRLQDKFIVQAFMRSAAKGHLDVVSFLWSIRRGVPCAAILAKVLGTAAKEGCYELVDFIGNLCDSPIVQNEIENALSRGAMRDHLELVQHLCSLNKNVPSRKAIEKAYTNAIKSNHWSIAQYLIHLECFVPSQAMIDNALSEAISNGQASMVQHLCEIARFVPSQMVIERSFQHAVKMEYFDIAQYLCNIESNKPRCHIVEQAMELAAKAGHLAFVQYLCFECPVKPRPIAIDKALQAAAQFGHVCLVSYLGTLVGEKEMAKALETAVKHGALLVVQHCCELTAPNKKTAKLLHRMAVKQNDDALADYLSQFLPNCLRIIEIENEEEDEIPFCVESLRSPDSPLSVPASPSHHGFLRRAESSFFAESPKYRRSAIQHCTPTSPDDEAELPVAMLLPAVITNPEAHASLEMLSDGESESPLMTQPPVVILNANAPPEVSLAETGASRLLRKSASCGALYGLGSNPSTLFHSKKKGRERMVSTLSSPRTSARMF